MTQKTHRKIALAALLAAATLTAAGCSTRHVANTTGDVVGFTGRTTVHAVAGAGRLVGRGVGATYTAFTDD
jgi:hypothetical protein